MKARKVVTIVDNIGQRMEVTVLHEVLGSVYFMDSDGDVQKVSRKDWKLLRARATVRKNPRRSARGLGQLHGPNCRIGKKNPVRAKRNPMLGVFGANPKARVVRELGRVVEVRYKRKDDGGLYFHKYTSKPRLLALSDGSIWIKGA